MEAGATEFARSRLGVLDISPGPTAEGELKIKMKVDFDFGGRTPTLPFSVQAPDSDRIGAKGPPASE